MKTHFLKQKGGDPREEKSCRWDSVCDNLVCGNLWHKHGSSYATSVLGGL